MCGRHVLIICALICAHFLVACGGDSTKDSSFTAAPAESSIFAITAEEQAALAAGDEAALAELFGDPATDRTSSPPPITFVDLASFSDGSKTASRWNWNKSCKKHGRKWCWSCRFKKCDNCDHTNCDEKDDKAKCKNPCKKCDKRDCKDKGDNCKNPCKKCGKPDCKDKGEKCKNPCKKCGKQNCKNKGDRCKDKPGKPEEPKEPPCTCKECKIIGIKCETERFWEVDDCCDRIATVEHSAQVWYSGSECVKAGVTVVFKRDGQEIGRAETDENGVAVFVEHDVPNGQYKVEVCVDANQEVEPSHNGCDLCNNEPHKCKWHWKGKAGKGASVAGENPTHDDGDPNNDGDGNDDDPQDGNNDDNAKWLCCESTVVVFHTCVRGALTGKGPIQVPCINPDGTTGEPFGIAMFNFRLTYNNGNIGGSFSYSDPHNGITIDEEVTWIVMDGVDAWFGTEEWMVHMHDAGLPKPKPGDTFHIWIWDKNYAVGGNVLNCFVRNSFAYTYKCP